MKLKYILITVLVLSSGIIIGQRSLNEYKYVTVPNKFDFLKSDDQYQLNSLTKFLFKKEGFQTLYGGDVRPEELIKSSCLGLTTKVNNTSGLLNTKLVIELVNCRNETIFTSAEGRSKEKDYKKGYQEALRKAFKSITELNYSYKPVKESIVAETQVEKEKVVNVPFQLLEDVVKVEESSEVAKTIEIKADDKVRDNIEEQEVKDIKNEVVVKEITGLEASTNLLYAQANPYGFQLVDSTPKVVYILLKTSRADVYILKNKNGILFKKDNHWIVEYYEVNELVEQVLEIKF